MKPDRLPFGTRGALMQSNGSPKRSRLVRLGVKAWTVLPEGRPLATDVWERRHRGLTLLVWLHAAGLLLAGILLVDSHAVVAGLAGGMLLAFLALVAGRPGLSRRVRSTIASLALLSASSFLVHLSGGYIEMHFHFFVALTVIALYHDWFPFLVAIGFVLIEHGVVGVLYPSAVYNHPSAQEHPWLWAGVHALFVSAASAANLLAWRLSEQQALHDPLTKLGNRALFRDRVEHAFTRARRRSDAIAVIFIDLDRFKPVNDTFGHDVGDRVLVVVAERLQEAVRAGDTVSRFGGDEFAILLEDITDTSDVTRVARRIIDSFREPIPVRGGPVTMRVSLGIAMNEDGATDVDGLIRDADVAMYLAKGRGGGRYETSTRACARPSPSAWSSRSSCATPSRTTSFCSTTSQQCRCRGGRWSALRRWCAGSTRRAAWSRRACSFPSPRRVA
jgi:diguanylate cyclase (GGDEF)-like protein